MSNENFENYLLNKKKFLVDMLSILHDGETKNFFEIELDIIEDIIHHFNVFVKGEISTGIGVEDEK